MKAFFNKINTYLIKNKPFHWIIGWHVFIPILLLLFIVLTLFSFGFSLRVYDYNSRESRDFIAFFLGFVSLMGFILFIIRQAKYNSFRIHHHIPYKKGYLIFASFWLIATLFALVPFIPELAYTARITHYVNQKTTDFDADKKALCYGDSFFEAEQKSDRVIKKEQELNSNSLLVPLTKIYLPSGISMFFTPNDSVIIKRANNNFNYYNSYDDFPIHLDKASALNIITRFIKTAQKYDIKLTDYDPESIFNKRKQFYFNQDTYSEFSLYQNPSKLSYSGGRAYDYMISNYDRYYNDMDDFFELLIGVLLFASIIALILWIFVSVPLAQFGYAVLFSVLLAIFVGVVSAVLGISNANSGAFYFVYIMISIVIYFIAFVSNSKWSNVFKIVSHVVFVFLILMFIVSLIDNHVISDYKFYYFSAIFIIGVLLSVLLYKPVYAKSRIMPQE